ncbi:CoA ester lyase [Nocardioides baekrokdamisoli]|uniref:CoA ester lyase n=1 Tax=Nocardioides baekrokdamisoli TaxID=1804624 RepID=A0A3G9IIJ1_9ACTN|nr:aldolase/citrate lyase family protein [Nocardioides baekrokdamisoli]BBH15855.1 CoA ester lyase [Nocardioides baekrokdamisoli]
MNHSADLTDRRAVREKDRVDAAHARSWQLVNALWADQYDAAQLGRADAVILDIEDAVDDSKKDLAREYVVEWLGGGGTAWVRINDVTTDAWRADVEALAGLTGLAGVVLAKAESAASVTETFRALGGTTPVTALVESALGVEEAVGIARAEGAFRLAFGGGDYRKDTGAENTPLAMAYPRSRLVVASKIGGLTGPIDTPTVSSTHGVIREQCADGVSMGMTGKLCLDGEQPVVINESMSPTSADVAWAVGFVESFEAGGRVIRDGSDKPRLARAEMILLRADYFRISLG